MAIERKIQKVFRSKPTLEGAGVHLKRAFGYSQVPLFDPFLLLDDFRSNEPQLYIKGFPWHPHRGIETITYMLNGFVEHGDSIGNEGVIGPGDIQWMTAGGGILHQEMPKGDKQGLMEGFQLWANLPASHKMMDARYREVVNADVPEVTLANGGKIRVICGKVGDIEGPVRDVVIEPEYLDITIPAKSEYVHPTRRGHNVFAYVIGGRALFCHEDNPFTYEIEGVNYFDLKRDRFVGNLDLVLFGDGEQVVVTTQAEPVRFLLVSGKPIGEPIAWGGPIVMNTQEQLRTAFEQYRNGTFIKQPRR